MGRIVSGFVVFCCVLGGFGGFWAGLALSSFLGFLSVFFGGMAVPLRLGV